MSVTVLTKCSTSFRPGRLGVATFVIENFSKITESKFYTEPVVMSDFTWRLMIFPRGNEVNFLSLYLELMDIYAYENFYDTRFVIEVVNQADPKQSRQRTANHIYSVANNDWGFTQFMSLEEMRDKSLQNDTLVVNVDVEFAKCPKLETGYVGLKSAGARCCVNTLLQTLYHIPAFRKVVYQLPAPVGSVESVLQQIFTRLQFGRSPASGSKELAGRLGWSLDTLAQRDAQELDRVLFDILIRASVNTNLDGAIESMFQGTIRTFIKCAEVDFVSKKEEPFLDLALSTKGCENVVQSLDKLLASELLDGKNKYYAEGHGLQTAHIGRTFTSLPAILHLHLKDYAEIIQDPAGKFVFPLKLNLSKFMADAHTGAAPVYTLFAIVAHDTDNGIRHAALIRSGKQTLRLEDESVKFFASFFDLRRETCIDTLVYLRESDEEQLLASIPYSDIPQHLIDSFAKEEAERQAMIQEKLTDHLYTTMKVATESDFRKPMRFDLVNFESETVNKFRVLKTTTFKDLKTKLASSFCIPVERQRLWWWEIRQNKTFRVSGVVTAEDQVSTAPQKNKVLHLFLEVTTPHEPPLSEQASLLFFKYYEPSSLSLRYAGYAILDATKTKSADLVPILNNFVGQHPNIPLLLFEEVKPTMIDPLAPRSTLRGAELGSGDIIVFQNVVAMQEAVDLPHASVPDYYDYLLNSVKIKLRRLDAPGEAALVVEMSKKMVYEEVVLRIAAILGADPMKIALRRGNHWDGPSEPIRNPAMLLPDIISSSTVIYYEIK